MSRSVLERLRLDTVPRLRCSTGRSIVPYGVSCFLFLLAIFLGPVIGGFTAWPYMFSNFNFSEQQSVDLPIFIIAVHAYSIILSMLYAHIFLPDLLPLQWIFTRFGHRFRYHRSHISHMRLDRMRRLVQPSNPFTIFVLGTKRPSISVSVTWDTTVSDILWCLWGNGHLPEDYQDTHRLCTLTGRPIQEDTETVGNLGLAPMAHLCLRYRCPGGVSSSSSSPTTPRTSQSSSSTLSPDSPSKNTRSLKNSKNPAVIVSPTKRRKILLSDRDLDVWDTSDAKILAAEKEKWKSPVYDHYEISVERLCDQKDGSRSKIRFKFTCRFDPVNHTHFRDREKTAQGTTNLSRGMACCLKRRNVNGDSPANAQQNLHRTVSTYSEPRHRALIALLCAASHRPFNSVKDHLYVNEVEMLRPGTKLPTPSTVSRDLQTNPQRLLANTLMTQLKHI